MRKNYTLKCEYEKNEIDIITHETCELISIKTKKLIDLESKFKLKSNQFFVDINELDQNYNNLIELAKKYQTESFELKHFLYAVNWKLINENIIEKINFYKDLKFTMQPYLPELNNE
jgi:hypothetical protein